MVFSAFPATGCGGFGKSAKIISEIIINTVCEQLTSNSNIQLVITFVLQQSSVLDAFNDKINSLSKDAAGYSILVPETKPPL